jgi:uncharacterized protein YueI
MRIEMKSNQFPSICIGQKATITQGELEIVTNTNYRLLIEIPFDNEWLRFLTQNAHENHLRWRVNSDYDHVSNWQIVIECDKSTIMWIGYWFNQWKANK